MSIVVEESILINRSPEQVFGFVSNFENDPKWRSEVKDMRRLDAGEVHMGQKIREESILWGRKLVTVTYVTELEPGCRVRNDMVSGPVPVVSIRTVEPVNGGARFTYRLEGDVSRVWIYRVFKGPLAAYYQKRFKGYLQTLKQVLEK